jgi:hypothetical protein
MTTLEAIKSTVAGYPLPDNSFIKVLLDRGLSATAEYSGKTKAFELATADIYIVLVSSANVSEGGFSVSISEKANLTKMANAIYKKHDDTAGSNPTVSDASSAW